MRLDREGAVFVLRLGADENRLDPERMAGIEAALDTVEAASGPAALVTVGEGDAYSSGYDLRWLRGRDAAGQRAFVARHQRLLARLLRLAVPSVAAVNGHAVGGGALLALAHDLRVAGEDGARLWLPEIDLRIPFRPAMVALLQARLRPDVCRDLVLAGVRLSGAEALARGVVDAVAPDPTLLAEAIRRAAALADKDRRTYGRLKERLYGDVAAALEAPPFERGG